MKKEEIAYIAGVLDGEGYLGIGKYPRLGNKHLGYRGHMVISNTHIPMLQHIKKLIGGKIVLLSGTSRDGVKRCFTLTLTTNSIKEWLPQIEPYLIVKKEQASTLLEFLKRQSDNGSAPISDSLLGFYERSYQKLKDLKNYEYTFKEENKSLGNFDCAQCGKKFERSTRNPKKIYCSLKCKKIVHYTRSNKRISLGIPAWNALN